eukprot:TRINITY_DN3109_c0_g1_i2.p1 TRINITY_DN3109_c0_g1~~TRINITY_DN3109_c0_g1_i2.p1  ORF type:complete len:267 (-),score=48.36 TRINITY_DN3109_c0_g1_i2:153-953(-)
MATVKPLVTAMVPFPSTHKAAAASHGAVALSDLCLWGAQACLLISLSLFWSWLPVLIRASIVSLLGGLTLGFIWFRSVHAKSGLLPFIPDRWRKALNGSILEICQSSLLTQYIPELLALIVLSLSSHEQRLVLRRLPQSMQDLFTTKIICMLPNSVQSMILPPVERVKLVPEEKVPIRRKRFEDVDELRKNVLVQVLMSRMLGNWKTRKAQLTKTLWYFSSAALLVAVFRSVVAKSNSMELKVAVMFWLSAAAVRQVAHGNEDDEE